MQLANKNITIRELQEYIKSKDYQPGLEHGYFMKLIEEIGELADAIRKDKKRADNRIHFVLLNGIGNARVEQLTLDELEDTLNG